MLAQPSFAPAAALLGMPSVLQAASLRGRRTTPAAYNTRPPKAVGGRNRPARGLRRSASDFNAGKVSEPVVSKARQGQR